MLQLTYISTVARGLPTGAVVDILAASRRNNAAAGVTGLLLYDGRRFLQALEGDAAAIAATYERIKADPRHRALVLLSSREILVPAFGAWAMAFEQARPGEAAAQPSATIAEQVDMLTAGVDDPNLRETFRSFARVRTAA